MSATIVISAVAQTIPSTSPIPFDPRSYQSRVNGPATQVLVLGTPHLSGTPDSWDPAALEPLLAKLESFRPGIITIEALSGQSLSHLWQYREIYGDTATSYGGRTMILGAAGSVGTGLDRAQAEAQAVQQLRTWPAEPTPAQRRRLAALFATAWDPSSALVQWWRLDPKERRPEDGITTTLMAQLNEFDRRRNENYLIASRLATRLGLERVYPVDAQDDDVFTPEQSAEFGKELFPAIGSEMKANPKMKAAMEFDQHLSSGEETLATYRAANEPETGRLQADMEWLRVIDRPTIHNVGRIRMGGWEVRNLRIVANIRQVVSTAPGSRVLLIIGVGHKPWIEAYLRMMSDVKIVDAETVLQ